MRKFREILRLHVEARLSQNQIARSLNISKGKVNQTLQAFKHASLTWPPPVNLSDNELLQALSLSNPQASTTEATNNHFNIDWVRIHQELKRKGITLQLLWEEYVQQCTSPCSYTHFCYLYRRWKKTQSVTLRQNHKAGDKCFVDYCGPTIAIQQKDGVREAQVFVGVLGASNYTFAEATWSQSLSDWVGSHVRLFAFLGGVPHLIVPDNLKSGVQKTCRYEPDLNPTYAECIEHYQTAVMPARPYKPRDKAKAENGVLLVERWIMARLRNLLFFSLTELNQKIAELLTDLNTRSFKKFPGSRQSLFEQLDRPALKSLPAQPYEWAEFKTQKVPVDYHVEWQQHYYSVPYRLVAQDVTLKVNATCLWVLHQHRLIAQHPRSNQIGGATTLTEHMPKAHKIHTQWTPVRLLRWAEQNAGTATVAVITQLIASKRHPEPGFRAALGLMRLSQKYTLERLEQACHQALQLEACSYKTIASILKNGLNQTSPTPNAPDLPVHDNIRGATYYFQSLEENPYVH